MPTNAKTLTPETAVAATDRFPFGDASADGWAVIQAQKLAEAVAAVSDDLPGVRAALGVPRRFQIVLASPTTKEIIWVSGATTLNSLTYATVDQGAGAGLLTIRLGLTPVAGWTNLPLNSGDAVTVAPDAPVVLTDGALFTVHWTGDGTGLSVGFSE